MNPLRVPRLLTCGACRVRLLMQSVGVLSRLLDNWSPLVDFGLEETLQRFGIRFADRYRHRAQFRKARPERCILYGGLECRDQLVQNRLRRALRRIKTVPYNNLESFHALLSQSWNVLERRNTLC